MTRSPADTCNALLQVAVTCQTATGQLLLQSRHADAAAQTTHLRGSITCSTAAGRRALTAPPTASSSLAVVRRAPLWLVALTTAGAKAAGSALLPTPAGTRPASDAVHGGCLAGVDTAAAQSGAGTGYRLHPAAADGAMHTGALNPAAPRDGLTRVPAALRAYNAAGSCSGQYASAWACVDSGTSLADTSRVNTYRCCSCCRLYCIYSPLRTCSVAQHYQNAARCAADADMGFLQLQMRGPCQLFLRVMLPEVVVPSSSRSHPVV